MGDTWNNSEVEDYRHPRPEPLSIEISDHPIEVDQYSAFATYNGLLMNFKLFVVKKVQEPTITNATISKSLLTHCPLLSFFHLHYLCSPSHMQEPEPI